MFDEIKKKTINVINKTSNVVLENSKKTYQVFQDYYYRERESLPNNIISKIDYNIRLSSRTKALFGEITYGRISIYETKLGGFPYLPKDMMIPKDSSNIDMRLLVQICCDDLKRIPYFPHEGMLQIYLSRNKLYGMNINNHFSQEDFKVLYYRNIDKSNKLEHVMKKTLLNELEDFPIRHEYLLYFSLEDDYIYNKDIRYLNEFRKQVKNENLNYKEFTDDEIIKMTNNNEFIRIKIGGYPNFINHDPRLISDECNILLFQLVSDGKNILLKDKGIMNFFISYNDLLNLNFNKVFYTWDAI